MADIRGEGKDGELGDGEEDPEAEARAAIEAELEAAAEAEAEVKAKAELDHEYTYPPQWGVVALRSMVTTPSTTGAPPHTPKTATPPLSKNPGHRPSAGEGIRFRLQIIGLKSMLPSPPPPAPSRVSTAASRLSAGMSSGLSAGLNSAKKAAKRASKIGDAHGTVPITETGTPNQTWQFDIRRS